MSNVTITEEAEEFPVRLKPEVKAQWVAALRGGDYQQGTNTLRTRNYDAETGEWANGPDRFCCLGVLCELAVKDGAIPPGSATEADKDYEYGADAFTSVLPAEVVHWAYRGQEDYSAPAEGQEDRWNNPQAGAHSLGEWNDGGWNWSEGVSSERPTVPFDGIADLIEQYL